MLKALKVVLVYYGILHILLGLIDITAHDLVANMYGFGEAARYVNWMGEVIGAAFIAIGVWVIVAARDPVRHIDWVKFAITFSGLVLVVSVHSIIVGYVDFSQIMGSVILPAVNIVLLLAFYPWRLAKGGE